MLYAFCDTYITAAVVSRELGDTDLDYFLRNFDMKNEKSLVDFIF